MYIQQKLWSGWTERFYMDGSTTIADSADIQYWLNLGLFFAERHSPKHNDFDWYRKAR